jgi:CBS domain-containing protein
LHQQEENVRIALASFLLIGINASIQSRQGIPAAILPVVLRSENLIMLVRDVLARKGSRVITIDHDATVHEAIAKLVQNNIGSLPVVSHDGQLEGIFSERDVLRIIHNRGENFGRLRVAELMTVDPVTCKPDDNVNDVMCQMGERQIAKVPVLDGSNLVGIISVGDMIKLMNDQVCAENQHLISYIHGFVLS